MSVHVHSKKSTSTHFMNRQKDLHLDIHRGQNRIPEELFEEFKEKIAADPDLSVVQNLSEVAVAEKPAEVVEVEADPEPQPEEAVEEAVTEDDQRSSKRGKRNR